MRVRIGLEWRLIGSHGATGASSSFRELQRERDTVGALLCGLVLRPPLRPARMAKQPPASATRCPPPAASRVWLASAAPPPPAPRHNTTQPSSAPRPAHPMCGIFFSLSRHGHIAPDDRTATLLRNRGPDHTGLHQPVVARQDGTDLKTTFLSTVLSLRGTQVISQPLVDPSTASVLCWNGEAWSINGDAVAGNDSQLVFEHLLKACAIASSDTKSAVVQLLSHIRGPYALVFFDAVNNCIYYGRDCLGRRSLLQKSTSDGSLVLSSVCDNATGDAWTEVEADGIYLVDLNNFEDSSTVTLIPHTRLGETPSTELSFVGRCCTSRSLLIQPDPTVSTLEP